LLDNASDTLSSFVGEVTKHSLRVTTLPSFSALSAEALLAPPDSAILFVAEKGVNRIDSLKQAVEATELAGNQLLGVLLKSTD
jgi:hypothetical protein